MSKGFGSTRSVRRMEAQRDKYISLYREARDAQEKALISGDERLLKKQSKLEEYYQSKATSTQRAIDKITHSIES